MTTDDQALDGSIPTDPVIFDSNPWNVSIELNAEVEMRMTGIRTRMKSSKAVPSNGKRSARDPGK